ncbi:unnamed protein product, partial [Phaeothamnion confervicola]
YEGRGVPQDFALARLRYQTAAADGNTLAMRYLGLMEELGQGVPVNIDNARRWFALAAKNGDQYG